MKKVLIFPVDSVIQPSTGIPYDNGVTAVIQKLESSGDVIIFMSHDRMRLTNAKKYFPNVYLNTRYEVASIIKNNIIKDLGKYFIIIGTHDVDMHMAASNKLLFMNPLWCEIKEINALMYGLKLNTPLELQKIIEIIKNQTAWFYNLKIDERTTVLSLTNANTMGRSHSHDELELVKAFKTILKNGGKKYYEVLLYHFLAGIANHTEFREINDWAIFPSSGTELNKDMLDFKEHARTLMNGRKPQPIFIRHTATTQSHLMSKSKRLICDRHFDTIKLNDCYKGKLKDRTVCLFDDYLTNGTSFETARNLLLHENVKKMFFVSLGRFHNTSTSDLYYKQDYEMTGNLYKEEYGYKQHGNKWLEGEFDTNAVKEIENLYKIINI